MDGITNDRLHAELSALLPQLAARELDLLAQYLALVAQYSPALNLTAFRGERELAFELGAESLRLLELGNVGLAPARPSPAFPEGVDAASVVKPSEEGDASVPTDAEEGRAGATPTVRCVDLGSGVGSPVIPLAIVSPHVEFFAVESRQRRATFLRQVKAQLGLSNLHVLEMRTEDLISNGGTGGSAGQETGTAACPTSAKFNLATARAYGTPEVLCAHAAALLKPGGELRGYAGADLALLEAAAAAHGFTVAQSLAYEVGGSTRQVYRLRASGI